MKNNRLLRLSTEIAECEDFSFDDSLIPVDIKVMHDGLNLNESTIYEEAIEDAKASLKNKPILAYIKKNDTDDSKDFAGHEVEISVTDDGLKYTYLERPIGVIPQSNNYSIMEEDGKKFVFCRGYLWKEYLNDGYEILKENPNKSVSMEIAVDDLDFNEDGTVNIKKYRYLGVTVLGDSVLPAMAGAEMNVIGQFSKVDNKQFFEKIEKLNKDIETYLEGGDKMKEEKVVAEVTEVDEADESLETEEVDAVEVEDTNESDVAATEDKTEDVVEDITEIETETETEVTEVETAEVDSFTKTFELSHDDIRSKLYGLLSKVEEDDSSWYYISEVFNDHFIYSGYDSNDKAVYFKQGYVSTDVDVALSGDRVEMFVEFLTKPELETLSTIRKEHALFSEELETLRAFKAEKDQEALELEEEEKRKEKIDYINKEYPNLKKDVKDLFIGRVDEYETLEDIDSDVCVYIIKNKVSFSKTKQESRAVKAGIDLSNSDKGLSPYGDIFD